MGMNKREAQRAVERIFGPRAEVVRVSANERHARFLVFGGVEQIPDGRPGKYSYVPVALGSGDSWESAIDHAKSTPNGKLAIKQALEGQELAKKAFASKSPLEFASMIEEQAIKEAVEQGANEAAIAAIKQKFEKAKEKINEHEGRAAQDAERKDGQDSPDRAGDDGSRGEVQQGGEYIL